MTIDRVRVAAHAKLNLFLRVLAREAEGYHQVETAFVLLDLSDELVVKREPGVPRGEVRFAVHGDDTGPAEDNLAVRGARAALAGLGNPFGVAIELTKRIPVRAGLGGGSSDAAAALQAINALANLAIPRPELLQYATRLGADVAFFASGAPLALAWGRGERLYRLAPLPTAPVLVAVPQVSVATPDAYGWWDEMHPRQVSRGPVVMDADALASWGSVGRLGGNDLETPVFGKHPEIRALYERLAETRPLWVRMSGSGAAVAAVYRSERERDDAANQIGDREQRLFRTATCAVPPSGPVG
ncbi:MAG TPA: 4-(cytidine 5'-diphospho)-2-C-methyl-D-erythritol kinase [Gemmatimonadales bacterium]|nr:4-(cytidine 5'-diphospho)-2-C-methyl-D-erythritol kinase [Gemmatimonadales bacterium]